MEGARYRIAEGGNLLLKLGRGSVQALCFVRKARWAAQYEEGAHISRCKTWSASRCVLSCPSARIRASRSNEAEVTTQCHAQQSLDHSQQRCVGLAGALFAVCPKSSVQLLCPWLHQDLWQQPLIECGDMKDLEQHDSQVMRPSFSAFNFISY